MLSTEERRKLTTQLELVFPDYASLRTLVINQLDWNLNSRASDQSLQAAILAIFDVEEARDHFVMLLTKLRDMPTNKTLPALAGQLLFEVQKRRAALVADDGWYSPPTPFATCFLQGKSPFLDRQPLRKKLETTLFNGTYRVLVVNGGPKTGKSYSLRFLNYLARQCGAFGPKFRVADLDLKQSRSSQISVDFVVQRIIAQVRGDPDQIPRANGQDPHWGEVLAEWLAARAEDANEVWCIALDGFDSPLLPDSVRSFISHLANRALMSMNLRLLLVGYPVNELPLETGDVTDEEILGLPTSTDIEEFFTHLHAHKDRDLKDEQRRALARELIDQVNVNRNDPLFFPTLAKLLKSKVLTLFPA